MCDDDPTHALIEANRDAILRFHQEGLRRVKRALRMSPPKVGLALEIIAAVRVFHPMYAEDWPGWPEDSNP